MHRAPRRGGGPVTLLAALGLVFSSVSCGGRVDPLDPRAADRVAALAAYPDPWDAGYRAREAALAGFIARERGDDEEAEERLREAADLALADAVPLVEHARALLALGRRDEALERLRRALGIDPASGRSWLLLAEVRQAQGEREAALEAGRRAVRADPRDVEAALWLAGRLSEGGDHGAAAEVLSRALDQRSADARLHLALADAWLDLGGIEDARRYLRRYAGLALAPGPAVADRAPAIRGADGGAGAADLLESALGSGEAGAGPRLELARLLIADGRPARARRHLEALPPIEDGDHAGLLERARLLLGAGDPWGARRLLLEEPAAAMADPEASSFLARVEAVLGRREVAEALMATE